MKLIEFKGQNTTIAKNQPEYFPMPAYIWNEVDGRITCCWKLSFRERLRVLFTGVIWHDILTFSKPVQPQLLSTFKPEFPKFKSAILREMNS